MNQSQVKNKLFELTSMFFQGATVAWVEQTMTKPVVPYVTLRTGNINKTLFPCHDEAGDRYYPCSTIAEINLYTKGRPRTVAEGVTGNYENTATSDLMEFVKFLESGEIQNRIAAANMDIQLNPPIRDLTELLNDSKYRYRAMAEFTVSYMEKASGRYGVSDCMYIPNYSGGNTREFTAASQYEIKEVEVKEDVDNE
ncbi:hypothetical protein [Lacrimispora sp.]|uniref:hypothetical protein n=1 Tax=Lacrimispora sp. TaxID=2719234 RepID=UPI0028ADABDA|nr:hypothetical protein [Lacrimispora sp.]